MAMPVEATRGGTVRPIKDPGQSITIHAIIDGHPIWPETPNIAQEFFQQLEESKAPNGCIMLPGNLQYWQPCKWYNNYWNLELSGIVRNKIDEPIHFSGPSPGDQSAIAVEEKQDLLETSQPDHPLVTNQDDSRGAAQQSPFEEITTKVQMPIMEELKEPEPPQTVEPAEEATIRVPSVNAFPWVKKQPIEPVQQSTDPNQATLQAFQSILAQQLREQREH